MAQQPRQAPSEPRTRPRRLRIAAAGLALLVTLVAVLGAIGVIPVDGTAEPAFAGPAPAQTGSAVKGTSSIALSGSVSSQIPRRLEPTSPAVSQPAPPERPERPELPAGSGQGKRIVFDIGEQRIWLVSSKDKVRRTYLASGSLTDNLGPGTYEVYSKSRYAVGIDDSGTMQYMVRFTQGEYAAIGFHDIPVDDGEKVQTVRELGSPQSHGCIRQQRRDAKALWQFAPVGTTVVVLD